MITDPEHDAPGPVKDVGAVYLYDGRTLEVISVLTGRQAGDGVGSSVTILDDGNYAVASFNWGGKVGAVTWGNAGTGITGVVSAANSLVGTRKSDRVGGGNIYPLAHGNFLVCSPDWSNGGASAAGAVTWVKGSNGLTGPVSPINSLTGSAANDGVGGPGSVTILSNGNYVVCSPYWDNGPAVNAGAVTLGLGASGVRGLISSANSLVGGSSDDVIGGIGPVAVGNGNFLVHSPWWDNGVAVDAGSVTWVNGNIGIAGPVSSLNSLVGSQDRDSVGGTIAGPPRPPMVLNNGNYVVCSPKWNSGNLADAGAVTWGNGNAGVRGAVSAENSLVGSNADDRLGELQVDLLAGGNYVVRCPVWDNGSVVQAGAVTWGNGTTGVVGAVSAANSLTGSQENDFVGNAVTALTNGHYVVVSPLWAHGSGKEAGAVTWCSGTTGGRGPVSIANSLVGQKGDWVGWGGAGAQGNGVTALSNGNYVVSSPDWRPGVATGYRGAATWGSGTSGIVGLVSADNSLIGLQDSDDVSSGGVVALKNGNYVVISDAWNPTDRASASRVGAVTWGNGATGIKGAVSEANSLVGRFSSDNVGLGSVIALSNGNYVVSSPECANDLQVYQAGAVTWGSGTAGVVGKVSISNSLMGGQSDDQVGSSGVKALRNGNYLVTSVSWRNGAALGAGAVTWGDGSKGVTGEVSALNSLVGSAFFDAVSGSYYAGAGWVKELSNGDYVVNAPDWGGDGGEVSGSVTWGSGTAGVSGVISTSNSILGTTTATDPIAGANSVSVTEMEGGKVLVLRSDTRNGGMGAVAVVAAGEAAHGMLDLPDTVFGTLPLRGSYVQLAYDPPRSRVVISHWIANRFTVLNLGNPVLRDWELASFGGSGAVAGTAPSEDFDGDGVSNLLEFAFGTAAGNQETGRNELEYVPTGQGGGQLKAGGLPIIEVGGTQGKPEPRILFTRRRDYLLAGLIYTPQFSAGLDSWQSSNAVPIVLASNETHQIVSVPWPEDIGGNPVPRFFRVRVETTGVNRQ